MQKMFKPIRNLLNLAIVISLTAMSILVFGNAVLRYVFDSGISWTEEMARFLLIWMTFLGAIAALKDNQHLGVDMFVKKLPMSLRKIAFVLSNLMVLYCLWLVFLGSWNITILNIDNRAPATGMRLFLVYGIGVVTSISMGAILLYNIFQALFKKNNDSDLTFTSDSEE
ncbi:MULTISPECIES: TRAP transporter small permease [unclassified Paenibacillus]|uniref:TRAP transporter small permease n=1 Tax=unclassified Paenibacillus TaxID=185978 RepID=UPI001B63DA51|nr:MULTISPECIES: TRAP transporter small permease [unclassified Paenibacillus]MBP1155769.1 TRAP-type C4-dicarboxylate transport system permease small subunit [Paenibacillus sp. PvP091]MBP1168845.1 TRAP-type C4-dicarboxylate transport system permease small subunit [Paenibacillus sp. PvR098]MBP2439873.1 TRAP-type C4-dicarboxylate transport system permease small subunit [Paenibacillus sp. PvP052]